MIILQNDVSTISIFIFLHSVYIEVICFIESEEDEELTTDSDSARWLIS